MSPPFGLNRIGFLATACSLRLPPSSGQPGQTLTIVHVNDVHSHLAPESGAFEFEVDGVPTQAGWGGFARVTQAFDLAGSDVLKLHGGDALQGTLYYTLYKGEADAQLMNTVCFDAMVVGNHEFDDSDVGLQRFIAALHSGTCKTPVLGANIHPQVGTPLAPQTPRDWFKASVIKHVSGMNVGLIGVTDRTKAAGSTRALKSTQFEDEATAIQREVDRLKAQGIDRIVVLSHMGFTHDLAVIPRVSDIDVVIGGDSHTLQGDFASLGLAPNGQPLPYPYLTRNKNGDTVCVAHAWEYAKAIGELKVEYAPDGRVQACGGRARLLIGNAFQQKNTQGKWAPVDEPRRQHIAQHLARNPNVLLTEGAVRAEAVLTAFSERIDQHKATRIARLSEDLCFVRVPGESVNRNGS